MRCSILRHVIATGAILWLTAVAPAQTSPRLPVDRADLHERVNAALGLHASRLIRLEVPGSPVPLMAFDVPLDGMIFTLKLARHSVRAPGYVLRQQLEDGTIIDVSPGPVRTYRGMVQGWDGSVVTASRSDHGLHASIDLGDGRQFMIEPARPHAQEAKPRDHVLYLPQDAPPREGLCGMPGMDDDEALSHAEFLDQSPSPSRAKIAAGGSCIAEIACDADVEYSNSVGSVAAVETRINAIVNSMNVIYEGQVGITHQVTSILVRTGPISSDPYSSLNEAGLLCEFISEWSINQTQIPRDLAILFTGKIMQGGVAGRAADFGDICNADGDCTCHPVSFLGHDGSYAWQSIAPTLACAAFLHAHEVGHLWGAIHCTCPGFIMNPGGSSCPTTFTDLSKLVITTYRDSLQCLDGACADNPLTNDLCIDATNIAETQLDFSTFGVGTECPALPTECNEGGGLDFIWDLWYRYTPSCTGNATVSLCGSLYDTRLAVYEDAGCPPLDRNLVGCNDDFCGPGAGSQVTFSVTAGQAFLLRVGGFLQSGAGTLNVSCVGAIPCPSDSDGDGIVGIDDFLAVLAQWGPCPTPCSADADNSGDVGIDDFLAVLADWGPCP